MHIVQFVPCLFQQRSFLEARLQQGRQQRLMAAHRKMGRDFHAVFQWSGDQNSHSRSRPFGVKQRPMTDKPLTLLGIETSCDETAAAVVRGRVPGPGEILSNVVQPDRSPCPLWRGGAGNRLPRPSGNIGQHHRTRAQGRRRRVAELDGIAATAGPGLIGGVMVGLTTAKALALGTGKPLIAVNHLMGHALTARLTHGVAFPFLLLLVSGGIASLSAWAAPMISGYTAARSTMRWAKPSTRQQRYWACPIPAARRWKRRRKRAIRAPIVFRARCFISETGGGPAQTFLFQD